MCSSLLQAAPVHNAIKRCKTSGKAARTADRLYEGKYKMKKVNWLVVGIIVIITLLFLFGGGMMTGGWGYRGMMGGHGMMGWGYSPFGWIGMIFM